MKCEWQYRGQEYKEIHDSSLYGFVYLVTFYYKGQYYYYIGQKSFYSNRKVKKGKKELAAMTDKRGSKFKSIKKESNWLSYQGSCKDERMPLMECVGKQILEFAENKGQLTYLETKYLFQNNVLETDTYLNTNILGKFYKKNTK